MCVLDKSFCKDCVADQVMPAIVRYLLHLFIAGWLEGARGLLVYADGLRTLLSQYPRREQDNADNNKCETHGFKQFPGDINTGNDDNYADECTYGS